MKLTVVAVVGCLVVLAAARPDTILNFDTDDQHHDQDMDHDDTITGTYRWKSPEGVEYFVTYQADLDGFRIVDSNAVPTSSAGVRADGNQGAFHQDEEIELEFDHHVSTNADGVRQVTVFVD